MTDLTTKIRDAMLAEMRRQVAENDAPNEDWWIEVDGWRVDIGGAFDLDKVAAAVDAVLPISACSTCGEPQLADAQACQCWNDE